MERPVPVFNFTTLNRELKVLDYPHKSLITKPQTGSSWSAPINCLLLYSETLPFDLDLRLWSLALNLSWKQGKLCFITVWPSPMTSTYKLKVRVDTPTCTKRKQEKLNKNKRHETIAWLTDGWMDRQTLPSALSPSSIKLHGQQIWTAGWDIGK